MRNVPEFWNKNKKTNYYVNYCHLSEIDVKVWQIVKAKQIIARNKAEKQRITTSFAWKVTKIDN